MKLKIMSNKLLVLVFVLTAFAGNAQQNIDRIIAIVGDKIILHSDIDNQVKQASQEQINLGDNPYCTVLEETMFQKLLVHQADVDSLPVKDEMVEQELEQRLRYFIAQIGSKEKFEEYYGKSTEKFKEDFREAIRERMKAQQMQQKISGDIKVTPKEIRDFFYNIPKDSLPFMGSKIEMAHLVKMPKVTAEEKLRVRELLNQKRTDILEGKESFRMVAVEISEDPGTNTKGGEFEMITKGTFVKEFDAAAFSLKEGDVSEVFETEFGYHIFQLLERRGEMYRGRHILVKPKVTQLQMAAASQKIDSIYAEIKSGKITFEDAVKKYSDDEETKFNNGKIYNTETGDTHFDNKEVDKQLFITIDGMEPGDISEPVFMQTPDQKQGIRIVKLITRSSPHVASLETDYPQISEAALSDKKNKAIVKWVKTKTRSMYVWVEDEQRKCDFEYPWFKEQ
ncbi:MAG TPA: peptidylprolyl isomerase [Flavobacteriales bacterium]|nr:peptidylprolyl isomerase [Flavobacteriales bacterium]